ncbi:osteoblast specific factor 2-related protein [Glycocaulis alkaliphilus]|nr:fasciclin domain-containing protein [Glycocaulis alkaliphilus]GGB71663.1 osteoblast specific factor 2-related protein [Glycocaulis alkaliphilus]
MRMTAMISSTAAAAALLAAPVLADHHRGPADIVDTAVAADDFNTLVAAVQAADLVDALKGEGPFTVFAPTDMAFADLPEGTVDTLLMPENQAQLQAVLTYHVVPGSYTSDSVGPGSYDLETLQGSTVNVVVGEDGSVTVDGANVITADIEASNGVIHVIDAVILPN